MLLVTNNNASALEATRKRPKSLIERNYWSSYSEIDEQESFNYFHVLYPIFGRGYIDELCPMIGLPLQFCGGNETISSYFSHSHTPTRLTKKNNKS